MSEVLPRLVNGRHTCKPRKYALRDDLPNTPEAKAIVVGVEDCMRMPPTPHPRAPNFTGVWEDAERQVTVAVNHAGAYVAFWISSFFGRSATHFLAKHRADGVYAVSAPAAPSKRVGTLIVHPRVENALQLDLRNIDRHIYTLARVSKKVTWSDRALAYFGKNEDGALVRRLEHAPIPVHVLEKTAEILLGPEMHRRLERFFSAPVSPGKNSEAYRAALAIETHVRKLGHVYKDSRIKPPVDGPWAALLPAAEAMFRRHVHAVMTTNSSTLSASPTLFNKLTGAADTVRTKSIFDRLADVLAVVFNPIIEPKPQVPGLLALGLPRPGDEPRFVYHCEVDAWGASGDVGVGVGAFMGTFRVQQLEPTRKDAFVHRFFLLSGSGGVSIGVQAGFRAQGVGRSQTEWSPKDFLGRFSAYEASYGGSVGVGRRDGFTEWSIRGPGGRPPLSIVFGSANVVGIEAGATVTGGEGYIRTDGSIRFQDVFEPPNLDEDYASKYKVESDVHFDLGSAALSQEGRDVLGFMAASELAAMRHDDSEVRLIGTADRVDVEWYNKALSKMRAENALQVLVDALGPDLRASTVTYGLGEDYAKLLGDPDKKPNPAARRVFVQLNGRTIATLRGSKSV